MSELCKHGIRNLTTNLPYCRRCDAEARETRKQKPKRASKKPKRAGIRL